MNKLFFIVIFSLVSLGFYSCSTPGCTDPLSASYDSDATEDDGSCTYYYGGREFAQLDVAAEVKLSSTQQIYFDGEYIGELKYYFPDGVSCANPNAIGTFVTAGMHLVKAVGTDEVREGYVTIDPQECKVILVENLPLKTGGGGGGGTEGLNGTWQNTAGTLAVQFNGSSFNFVTIESTKWKQALEKGYISYGSPYIKNLASQGNNTWACDALWNESIDGEVIGVKWSSNSTIQLVNSNEIILTSTKDGETLSGSLYRK